MIDQEAFGSTLLGMAEENVNKLALNGLAS